MFKQTICTAHRAAQWFVIKLIGGYQFLLSPLFGPRCRFYPSCSTYAIEAIQTHGVVKGCYLMCRRLLRCHPLNPGGIDPVPNRCRKHDGY